MLRSCRLLGKVSPKGRMSSFAADGLASELLPPAEPPTAIALPPLQAFAAGAATSPAPSGAPSSPSSQIKIKIKAKAKSSGADGAKTAEQLSFPPATQEDMQPLCTPPNLAPVCTPDVASRIVVVDDAASIQEFQSAVDTLRELAGQTTPESCKYNPWVVGIDTEWMPWLYRKKPPARTSEDSSPATSGPPCELDEAPVAIMQVGTRLGTFILDMQTISSPSFPPSDCQAINVALCSLLGDSRIYKLGYDLDGDMERAAASHGQLLPALLQWNGIIDIDPVSRIVYPGQVTKKSRGLSRVCAVSFGRSISKECQLSPWHQRPLSLSQLVYAALDGAVLVRTYDAMVATLLDTYPNANVDRYFEVSCLRFTAYWLDDDHSLTPRHLFARDGRTVYLQHRQIICNAKYRVCDGRIDHLFEDKVPAGHASSVNRRQHKSKYLLGKTLVYVKWSRQGPESLLPVSSPSALHAKELERVNRQFTPSLTFFPSPLLINCV